MNNLISYKIKNVLSDLAKETFPDIKHNSFNFKLDNRQLKTKHGDWSYPRKDKKSEIRIFNLSRNTKEIIKTSIHELAHNSEYSIYKETGHSKRFYKVYKDLLEKAIQMGLLNYEDIRTVWDITKLVKHHGEIKAKFDPSKAYKRDVSIVKIYNAYIVKETLKERGYKYSPIEQTWSLEINKEVLNDEVNYLSKFIDTENIITSDVRDLEIEALGYVIVDKCYKYKDTLKGNGYRFKGYNQKGNVWVKKIKLSNLEKEELLLKPINIILKEN
mgnify:CR=1 FL=1